MIDFGKRLTQKRQEKGNLFFSFDYSTKTHEREPRKKKERSCWQKIRQLLREYHTYVYVSK